MATLLNKSRTGFSLTCHGFEYPGSRWVLITMTIYHCGQPSVFTRLDEWRSIHMSDLERFVLCIIDSALHAKAYSFLLREPEFIYRQNPTSSRVWFEVDADRTTDHQLSRNYLSVHFDTTPDAVYAFADDLGVELDEVEAGIRSL